MLDRAPVTPQEVLQQLIEILQSARERKKGYFQPIEPVIVEHWLHGVQIGMFAAGIRWDHSHAEEVLLRRGISMSAETYATQLGRLGLQGEPLVDELLAFAIETWRLALERWPDQPRS